MQELAGECGSQALNPNELGAVLKVLSLLAAEVEADTAGELSTVRGVRVEIVVVGVHGSAVEVDVEVESGAWSCLFSGG